MSAAKQNDCGLGLFMPSDIAEQIQKWRRRYDLHFEMIPPHITLAYPPFVPESEWSTMRRPLIESFSAFRSFKITLKELGSFDGESRVLWLKLEDDGILAEMHAALQKQFPKYVPVSPLGYVPHVTVGFFDSDENLERARNTILAELVPMRFEVKTITYMASRDDKAWHLVDSLSLGTGLA